MNWTSIDSQAPPEFSKILASDGYGVESGFFESGEFFSHGPQQIFAAALGEIIEWMPYPDGSKKKENGE